MTEREKLKRDIDTLRESIRLGWLDLSRLPLTPEDARAIRIDINECVEDLGALRTRLDELDRKGAP
jgi:hypothetical protein